MALSLEGRWFDLDDDRFDPAGTGSVRIRATVRAFGTPANLTFAAVLVLAWTALISWTGAGPKGWQAHLCADLGPQTQACEAAGPAKDQSQVARVAP